MTDKDTDNAKLDEEIADRERADAMNTIAETTIMDLDDRRATDADAIERDVTRQLADLERASISATAYQEIHWYGAADTATVERLSKLWGEHQ